MSSARILIVEDEANIRRFVGIALEDEGFQVFEADSVKRALIHAASRQPDLVIVDLGLPDGDGKQLISELRGWLAVPILVLSARDREDEKVAALDAGADDYLVKPITIDELAARLRALVRRTAGHAQSVWQHGALEYDPASKTVRWRGSPVELTGRELALLEAFLTESQRVLSKAHLLEKLYDWSGAEPEGNSLEVHIHHLRRKIDPAIVRTVRGVGYALGSDEALR